MIGTQRVLAVAAALLAACLFPVAPAPAAEPTAEDSTILEVSVRGNRRMSDEAILANVKTRAGARFSETVANDDLRRLMKTGRFDNVVVVKAETTEGLVVTFVVTERKLITNLSFRGNKAFRDKRLRKEISLGVDDPLDPGRISLARMALEDFYRGEGYYFAKITLDQRLLRDHQQVVFTIVEGPRIRVKKLEFVFEDTQSFSPSKLRRKVQTKKALWIFSRGKLDRDKLDRDVVTLQNFYREAGFLDAEIAREVSFSPDKRNAYVRFIVNEGPRYQVAEVRFKGAEIFGDDELLSRLVMKAGRPYTMDELRRDNEAIKDAYGEIGYVDAAASPRIIFLAPDAAPPVGVETDQGRKAGFLIVEYAITEGDPFRVGRVTIRGNDVTKDRVIRRQVVLYPRQVFNTVAMKKSEQQLQDSQLFSRVSLTPYGDEEDVRNVLVDVAEGETARMSFGVGYSTNSGVLGNFSFSQRNFSWTQTPTSWADAFRGRGFKGDGQTLQLLLEPGVDMHRAKIDWREPYLFDRNVALGVGAYTFRRERESYDEGSTGGHVSLGKLFKNRWYGEIAVRPEAIQIDNLDDDAPSEVEADRGDHFTLSFQGTLVRDRTDSRWRPSRGGRLTLSAQQYMGDYSFNRMAAEYTHYWTLHTDALDRKHILAGRTRGDWIVGSAPVYERFYGGGVGGVRGFKFRGISPRTADKGLDDPIGGDFMTYLGAEYSFPIVQKTLRGVLFIDSGTVEESCTVTTWRVSVGAGVRLVIPYMGPVPMSLDFAVPLREDDEDDNELVSFTIGWVY